MNLRKVSDLSSKYAWLEADDRQVICERIDDLLQTIDNQPKNAKWNIRNKIGDRVKWYKEVHEVSQ